MSQIGSNTHIIPSTAPTTGAEATQGAGQNPAAPANAAPPLHKTHTQTLAQIRNTMDRIHKLAGDNITFSNTSLKLESFDKILPKKTQNSVAINDSANLVRAKVDEVNIRMQALNAKKLTDIARGENGNIDADVQSYIQAQNKLRNALVLYMEASGVDTNEHIRLCDNRITETLSFVGKITQEMIHGNIPEHMTKLSFAENINTQGLVMHGAQFLPEHVVNTLNDMYDKLASLDLPAPKITPEEYIHNIKELKTQIQTLQENITNLKETHHEATVVYDSNMVQALEVSLSAAKQRLEHIENLNPFETFRNIVMSLRNNYAPPSNEELDILHQFDFNKEEIAAVQYHATFVKRLFTALSDPETDFTKVDNALKNLAIFDRMHEKIFQRVNQQIESALFEIQHSRDPKLAREHGERAQTLKKIINNINPVLKIELDKIQKYYQKDSNPLRSRELIGAAFDGKVDMSTLLEANMRGFPLRDLALHAVDSRLTEKPKKIGQGNMNEVFSCQYALGDSGKSAYVFKGEYDARRSFADSTIGKLGHNDALHIGALNIATYEAAKLIHCQSAIAESGMGKLQGQWGVFMEHAQGKTMKEIIQDGSPALTLGETSYSLAELHTVLTEEQQKTVLASLLTELTKLEWADALTGQMDRHGGNYFFDINPDTFQVKITGIDNDACFGRHMVGLGKVRFIDIVEEAPSHTDGDFTMTGMEKKPTAFKLQTIVTDYTSVGKNDVRLASSTFGLNQIFKPLFITPQILDAILDLPEETYTTFLKERIGELEMDAALSRFRDMKEHALSLKQTNHYVQDNQWTTPEFLQSLSRTMKEQENTRAYQQQNFFVRDFSALKTMVDTLGTQEKL